MLAENNQNVEAFVLRLLEDKFSSPDFADCFVVEVLYNPAKKKLDVFLDSDQGILLDQCSSINRYLQQHLDESGLLGEKYTLDVSSPGVGSPLKLLRQYHRNIGRTLEITLTNEQREKGKLIAADEHSVTLAQEIKEKQGKKNVVRKIENQIDLKEVVKAVVKIEFGKFSDIEPIYEEE